MKKRISVSQVMLMVVLGLCVIGLIYPEIVLAIKTSGDESFGHEAVSSFDKIAYGTPLRLVIGGWGVYQIGSTLFDGDPKKAALGVVPVGIALFLPKFINAAFPIVLNCSEQMMQYAEFMY